VRPRYPGPMSPDLAADPRWDADVLGGTWLARTLPLRPDDEGEVVATLVTDGGRPRTEKAVLYVHGFVDYFFQTHLADALAEHGYTFYALDLRKYGRSLRPHQTPNYVTRLSDYAEELDQAARVVTAELGHSTFVVMGHSTGGLVTSLWADARTRQPDTGSVPRIDALVLNSPWFDLNKPWFDRVVSTRVIDLVGPLVPRLTVGRLAPHYGQALHRGSGGEWDYDLALKPHEGFPVRAGWLRAIRRGHAQVARGLDVRCPVLVLTSDATGDATRWHDALLTTDSVLDVVQTARLAPGIGTDVTLVTVPGGAHDLALSPEPARSRFFAEVTRWLDTRTEPLRPAP
jgi:alpha-beta hydrolase superfamily lysophospholipase